MTQEFGSNQGLLRVFARFLTFHRLPIRAGKATIFLLFLVLSGCVAPLDPKVGVRFAQADLAYGPAALDHAVAEFLEPPSASGGGGGGLFGGSSGGLFGSSSGGGPKKSGSDSGGGSKKAKSDKRKASADIDYREIAGQEMALVVGVTQPVAEGWRVDGTVRLGQGEVEYVLPAGSLRVPNGSIFLVFDGAVTLQARPRFLEAETIVVRKFALPVPGVLELGAGGGVRKTDSRLKVNAPLIKIDNRYRQTQTYGAIQARYTLPYLPLRGFAEGRYYGRDAAGMRAGIEMVLPLQRVRQ